MKVTEFDWLADENIHPDWITACRKITVVHTLAEVGLLGKSDTEILQYSFEKGFIVFTQDSDFGHLAVANKQPFYGIVFLRPGHLKPAIHLETIRYVVDQNIDVVPPFIVTGSHHNSTIRIRVRNNI